MKRSGLEATKGRVRSSPERFRSSGSPCGNFVRVALGFNGVVGALCLIIQWSLERIIVLDAGSLGIIIATSMMVWGITILVFLLARVVEWLAWAFDRVLARVTQPRPVRRASDSDLWDRWIDESPGLFR
jgi:hypothetical protein